MTNQIKSTKNNKIAEAPVISGLSVLVENELSKAQAIFAIRSILEKLQASAEGLAKLEANNILPVLDIIRDVFGAQAADNFYKVATDAIGEATESVQNTREIINTQLDKTQRGDLSPTNDMAKDDAGMDLGGGDEDSMDLGGGDDADMSMGDAGEEPDEDAFDLDSEEGMSAAGRPRKESIRYNVKALQESRNPDAMILNAYRKAFRESHQATRAVHVVAESFAIDLTDVIDIVQEAAKAVDEGKTWKDEKGKSSKNKDWSKDREEKKKSREDAEEVSEEKKEVKEAAKAPAKEPEYVDYAKWDRNILAAKRQASDDNRKKLGLGHERKTVYDWLNDPKLDTQVVSLQVGKYIPTDKAKGIVGYRAVHAYDDNYTNLTNPMYFKTILKSIADKFGSDTMLGGTRSMAVSEGKTRRRNPEDDADNSPKDSEIEKARRAKKASREKFDEANQINKLGEGKKGVNPFDKKDDKAPAKAPAAKGKKPDADKDGIPNWADKNPFKAGGKEDRKPSKKS